MNDTILIILTTAAAAACVDETKKLNSQLMERGRERKTELNVI